MIFKGDGWLSWYRIAHACYRTAALRVRIQTSPKKYKTVGISEGVASTLKPAQNIYKKDLFNPVSHQTTQMNNDPDLKSCRLLRVRV